MIWVLNTIVGMQAVTGFAGLLFVVVFFLFGRPRSFLSVALLLLEGAIFLVMVYALERHAVAPVTTIPDHQEIPALTSWGVLAVVQMMLAIGLWQRLVSRRGGLRGAWRARRSRRAALVGEVDPVRQVVAALDLLDERELEEVRRLVRPR